MKPRERREEAFNDILPLVNRRRAVDQVNVPKPVSHLQMLDDPWGSDHRAIVRLQEPEARHSDASRRVVKYSPEYAELVQRPPQPEMRLFDELHDL